MGKNPKDRQKYGRSFDERVELTRRTAISKIEANIPVYDAKGEEKNVEELSALLQKMSNRFRFIRWYHLLTEPGKMARKEFRQGEKE